MRGERREEWELQWIQRLGRARINFARLQGMYTKEMWEVCTQSQIEGRGGVPKGRWIETTFTYGDLLACFLHAIMEHLGRRRYLSARRLDLHTFTLLLPAGAGMIPESLGSPGRRRRRRRCRRTRYSNVTRFWTLKAIPSYSDQADHSRVGLFREKT